MKIASLTYSLSLSLSIFPTYDSSPYHFIFLFSVFCLFLFNKFSRNLPHCRYGRVQSVKIIISPGTIITTVPSSQPSPTGTITSTTELNVALGQQQQHSSGDHHHLSSTHASGISKCSMQQPTAVPSTIVGSTHMLEPSIGVNSCSVSNNNVTSSNHNCITMCAATIAFMDIKSASKAHLAEHKFDDRILTTEYYEPSAMHHGSLEGGSSLVFNSKMIGDGAANSAVGDMKDSTTHGRFTSTSSSHGLVWNSIQDSFIRNQKLLENFHCFL
jgi:hypothetical protein